MSEADFQDETRTRTGIFPVAGNSTAIDGVLIDGSIYMHFKVYATAGYGRPVPAPLNDCCPAHSSWLKRVQIRFVRRLRRRSDGLGFPDLRVHGKIPSLTFRARRLP